MASGSELERFHTAQDEPEHGYRNALAEIRGTGKRSHWIWYVFPQLAGLGHSAPARRFALVGRAEAQAYLEDPLLRSRLLDIMGSPIDVQKLVSSLTLFAQLSRELRATAGGAEHEALANVAERVLTAAAEQGYPRCAFTQRALAE